MGFGHSLVILSRYILREILSTMLAVLAVLLLIYVSNRFVRFLADASAGDLAGSLIYQLLALKTLSALTILLPLALFFSVVLTFGRLYQDHEMAVIQSCGISLGWLSQRVVMLAVLVAMVVAAISLYAAPWAEAESDRLIDGSKTTPETLLVSPGRFQEIQGGRGVIYIERQSRDGLSVENIFMKESKGDGQVVLSAPEARFDLNTENGAPYLELKDGFRYESDPVLDRYNLVEFGRHGVRLRDRPVASSTVQMREISTLGLQPGKFRQHAAELQWRLSLPLTTILLAALAVPLSRAQPRQGRFARIFMAILIYAIYNNVLGVAKHWVAQGVVSPLIGLWWVHLVVLIWILLMAAYQSGRLNPAYWWRRRGMS